MPQLNDSALIRLTNEMLKISKVIAPLYGSKHNTMTLKSDGSPVSKADLYAHDAIIEVLNTFTPQLQIISEESLPSGKIPQKRYYWLIDPIDGTRSFLKGHGSYAMNIALMDGAYPIQGILIAPTLERAYTTFKDGLAIWDTGRNKTLNKKTMYLANPSVPNDLILAQSNDNPAFQNRFQGPAKARIVHTIKQSSASKFGMIAEGKAHIYLRTKRTCAWDTATGQIMLEKIGGGLYNEKGERMSYSHQGGSWYNGGFLACSTGLKFNEFQPDFSNSEHIHPNDGV